jgi:opacity protein-like surface antigen
MKSLTLVIALIIACSASNVIAQSNEETQSDPLKERLGIRAGYAWTPNNIADNFGSGLNLTLHFIQRIKKPFSVDVALGAIYLGSTGSDITRDFFGTEFDDVSMRILTFTASPMVELSLDDRTDFFVSAGGGLYVVSLILDQTLQEFDLTNNQFGVTFNAGVIRRITTNWFLDAGVYLHKFWTADNLDLSNPDWIYLYSEGDGDPVFWTVAAGVALRLF